MLTVYGERGSGSVAVEAALTLAGVPFRLVERTAEADDETGRVNPLRQVPAVVLPAGELLTESAAILIWIAERYASARLAPPPGDLQRGQFLRWMSFVAAEIYALFWVRDDITRLAADPSHEPVLRARTADRIAFCWRMMEAQLESGRYLLGDTLSVLDLYVTVVSRWEPGRKRFYSEAPRMGEVVRRVDAEPRLAALWAERFPMEMDTDPVRL